MKALSGPPGGAESNPAIIPGKRIGRSGRAIPGSERPVQRRQGIKKKKKRGEKMNDGIKKQEKRRDGRGQSGNGQ